LNRVYVVADTHFGHRKVIQFEAERRPFATIEDHDRDLVARWNAVVCPKDTVWHLGDVFFGGRDAHGILGELNGIKRLVLGNHDVYPLEVYRRYFSKIFGVAELHGCILTHVPVHPCQLESRYKTNVHGHLHSKKLEDPRYVCVSVEQTGLAPVLLDEVLTKDSVKL
jgi:calcineurin-like phosphoesterase family protein